MPLKFCVSGVLFTGGSSPPHLFKGDELLAYHKSALKRARQSKERRMRNMASKSRAKTAVKAVNTAVAENQGAGAVEALRKAVSELQKIAGKGVIHKKRASRKISRLTRKVNKSGSTQASLPA
jgi:small subunit ribosomal protein S20